MTDGDATFETRLLRRLEQPLGLEYARTIGQHQVIAGQVYGGQDRISSTNQRMLVQLMIDYGELSERERNVSGALTVSMVKLGTRIFALANQMGLQLDEALALKYPGSCYYCGRLVNCTCEGKSNRAPKDFSGPAQPGLLSLSINNLQHGLADLYLVGNRKRGRDWVMRRFAEELAELLKAVSEDRRAPAIKEELADVMAWWLGLATMFEMKAPQLLISSVGSTCYACDQNVCVRTADCPH